MRQVLALLLIVPVFGCAVVPPASPSPAVAAPVPVTPAPAPPPAPAPRLTGDWRDWPITPGTWVYRQDDRGSIALFGTPRADAEVTLRCDKRAHAIYLSRRGAAPGNAPMTVRTTSLTRVLPTQPTGGTLAYMAAALSPGDGVLDAMGYSRGRFVIEQATLPTLVIPAWAEILRVTEDCRP